MKHRFFTGLFFVILSFCSVGHTNALSISDSVDVSLSSNKIVEGYATPSFKELYRTFILLGGMDINDPEVITEYIRLMYCGLYENNYTNDYNWHEITSRISTRIIDKKEDYRILYEVVEVFELDRYDFSKGHFPINKSSAMQNVGSMVLTDFRSFHPYCGLFTPSRLFAPIVGLILYKPLNVRRLRLPVEEVEKMLVRMEVSKDGNNIVYARIRLRIMESSDVEFSNQKVLRTEMRGEIQKIDFFYDVEMTKPIANMEVLD